MADEKQTENGKRLSIAKIYLKDLSFESPMSPEVFKPDSWSPKTNLNLRSNNQHVDGDIHEVTLTITVDAKDGDKTIFLVEVQQAGLFEMAGYSEEEHGAIVGSFCPSVLFAYAREAIASVIQKGGFPEFVLQPINFDALYTESKRQAAEAASGEKH